MTMTGDHAGGDGAAADLSNSESASAEPMTQPGATRAASRELGHSSRAARTRSMRGGVRARERPRDGERRAVDRAVAQERLRFAGDVHDLIMQDLSLALSSARTLALDPGHAQRAKTIIAAAERALLGARQMLAALDESGREQVIESVQRSVRLAARGMKVSFHADCVPPDAQLDSLTLQALVHIGREAVTNAFKHGDASAVTVVLERDDEWRLRVRDDGRGFRETDAVVGFGLRSMRRHAEALGGRLRIDGAPGMGTTVEAALP
jgi:two-component system, NarL family, sensor kinase